MPAPAAEPAPPKTELQELQLKATEKTDEVSLIFFCFSLIADNNFFLISVIRIYPAYVSIMRGGEVL